MYEEENVAVEQPEAQQLASETVEDMKIDSEDSKHVPLTALLKERKKRQEIEEELRAERNRVQNSAKIQEDEDQYESATKADVKLSQRELERKIEEKIWIKNNPEKYEKVSLQLEEFLKQRPNLALAINSSDNRYEEAYTLMEALSPKQQQQLRQNIQKKEAPNSPASVPKSTAINQTLDVMQMSDKEFNEWRRSKMRAR